MIAPANRLDVDKPVVADPSSKTRSTQPSFGYILFITTMTQAGLSWSLFIIPPIAVAVATAFQLDPIYVGYQVGIIFTMTVGCTLFAGTIIQRLGPVRAMQLAIAAALTGLILCAMHTITTMVLGAALFGFSHSLVNPSTALVLRERVSPKRRAFVYSVKQSSVPFGLMVSSIVGPAIVVNYDWRWALVPLAVVLVVLALALRPLHQLSRSKPNDLRRVNNNFIASVIRPLRCVVLNRSLLLLALGGLAFGMCQGSIMTFTSNLFVDEMGRSLHIASLVLMAVHCGGICGRLGWGHIADRLENPILVLRCIAVMICAMSALIALLPASTLLLWWFVLFFCLGLSAVGWNGLLISEFTVLSKGAEIEQQMTGAFFLLFCGGAISPIIFPWVHSLIDSYAVTIAAFGMTFSLVALVLVRHAPGVAEHHHPPTAIERDA